MDLDHINIRAEAGLLERLRDFYCEALGLETGCRPRFSTGGYWLYAGERPIVHLSVADGPAGTGGFGHLDHVAFRASGLAEFAARLDGIGVAYRSKYVPELEMTQLIFSDPAGTGLEVNFPGERFGREVSPL